MNTKQQPVAADLTARVLQEMIDLACEAGDHIPQSLQRAIQRIALNAREALRTTPHHAAASSTEPMSLLTEDEFCFLQRVEDAIRMFSEGKYPYEQATTAPATP